VSGPFGIAGEQSIILDAVRYGVAAASVAGCAVGLYCGLGHFLFPQAQVKRRSAKSPIKAVQSDGTLEHASGQLSFIYSIAGYDASMASPEAGERLGQLRAEWIAAMANHGLELRILTAKLETVPPVAPVSSAPVFAPLAIKQFSALAPFYRTRIIVIATTTTRGKAARLALEAADKDTVSALVRFGVERLTPETGCMDILGAYMSAASRPIVKRSSPDLAMLLNMDSFEVDRSAGFITFSNSAGRTVYGLVFSIARMGEYADAAFVPSLTAIRWECVISQCLQPKSRADTLAALAMKRRFAGQHKSAAVEGSFEETKDRQITGQGSDPLTRYGLHIIVYTEDQGDFDAIETAVKEKCADFGFYPLREGEYCRPAWQAAVPGQGMLTPTPRDLTARQVAALAPMALPWAGHARNEWLPHPVMYLRNAQGGVFGLNFHATAEDSMPSAHTKFIGVPGTGKTALITWCEVQLLANPLLRVFHIDHEKAAYPIVRALGPMGRYYDLAGSGGTNPCQRKDTADNRRHLSRILAMIIGRGREVSAQVQECIDRAVEINFSNLTPNRFRNIRYLAELAFPPEIEGLTPEEQNARKILLSWVNGPSGRLLTAPEDSIQLSEARMIGIDIGPLKEDPLNAALMLADLANVIRNSLVEHRYPTVVCVDETKYYTGMAGMVAVLEGLSDTVRRLNGAVWTTWQRPQQIADAGMLSVINAAPTTIAFVHPDTPAGEYVRHLGFSEAEARVVGMESSLTARMVRPAIIKQGTRVAVIDTDLSAIGPGPLRLLSGIKGWDALNRLDDQDPDRAVASFIGEGANAAAA